MSPDNICHREVYVGLFLTPESPEIPIARYKPCGTLIGDRQMYCEECQADMRARSEDPAIDSPRNPLAPFL